MISSIYGGANATNLYSMNNLYSTYSSQKVQSISSLGALSGSFGSSYINNTLSATDMSFLKDVSSSMSTLKGSSLLTNNAAKRETTSADDMKKYTEQLVKDYNQAVDTLSNRTNKSNTVERLQSSLTSAAETSKATLKDIGITVGDDGKLAIDQEKFDASLASDLGKVKSTMSGFADKTQAIATRGMTTSTKDLLTSTTASTVQNYMSEEQYQAGIRKMASNSQFMKFYYSAEAMLNLFA